MDCMNRNLEHDHVISSSEIHLSFKDVISARCNNIYELKKRSIRYNQTTHIHNYKRHMTL